MTITINKNAYGFDDAKFVLAAIDTKESRTSLTYVHVENNVMVGTDGKRLHTFTFDPELLAIPDGNYTFKTGKDFIILEPDASGASYPNWKLVHDCSEKGARFFCGTVSNGKRGNNSHFTEKAIAYATFNADFTATLNMYYLDPLEINGCEWYMTVNGALDGVRFDNCTKTAVIMPCRI